MIATLHSGHLLDVASSCFELVRPLQNGRSSTPDFCLLLFLAEREWARLQSEITRTAPAGLEFDISVEGKTVKLKLGTHFFCSVKEAREAAQR